MKPNFDISSLRHVAVLGMGVTGNSAARFFLSRGVEVTLLDTRDPIPGSVDSAQVIWNTKRWPGLSVDAAIVSPGLALDSCLVSGARDAGVQLLSDIDVFFAACRAPVIGITGTNGKSTVTSLVGHLLQTAGKHSAVGGNLGEAALDLLDDEVDVYTLELSSFQLERSALHDFHAACVLNITEDHLDKHGSMAAYVQSKQRIFAGANVCVFNRSDDATHPQLVEAELSTPQSASQKTVSFGLSEPLDANEWGIREVGGRRYFAKGEVPVCPVEDFPLEGAHNEENALAACALIDDLVDGDALSRGFASFTGLAHRFQQVASINGVTYVNDSKATNLGATMAALSGLPKNNQIVLIAGGDAKGVDLSPLAAEFVGRVNLVVALGQDAEAVAEVARDANVPCRLVTDMEAAVTTAQEFANSKNLVLLSPACASIDMFVNYAARGDAFRDAVLAIDANQSGGSSSC